ncbi:MAG: porin [Polyangiaceae bacterium]
MRIAISAVVGGLVCNSWLLAALIAAAPSAAFAQPAGEKKPDGSSVLTPGKTPPPPPTPGTAPNAQPKTPAGPPQSFNDETGMAWKPGGGGESNAGWHGMFYIRDNDENFRISPNLLLQLDFNGFAGGAVNGKNVSVKDGAGLPPRFFLRRLRFGLSGDFLKRWSFTGQVDIGNSTDNADGGAEIFAAPPGVEPTASTARFRPVQGAATEANLADAWINYSLCPCLNFQFGQFRPPLSMENRTSDWQLSFMDRSLPIRAFVVPGARETGLMIWGDVLEKVFTYEVAVVGGDGQNRPEVDTQADFAARVLTRPLGGVKLLKDAHIGVSARHGERDPEGVGYNYAPITSSFGYVLYNPSYTDSLKRKMKVIPSGGQNLIGGELRVPIGPVDIRGEAYYVANHTREAVDGFQFTNTERLGTLKGVGWYGQATWWVAGDSYISGEPGYPRPSKLNTHKKEEIKRGAELTLLGAGVHGDYDGNARGGKDDDATPGSAKNPATNFTIYQFSAAASYWHSKFIRMTFNYSMYLTPGSGSTDNLASVPANVFGERDPSDHLLHEFGLRLQAWF